MKKLVFTLLIIFTGVNGLAIENVGKQATIVLQRQVELLNRIDPYVEQEDLARTLVVRKVIDAVLENIESNKMKGVAPVTLKTMRLMQDLIIRYKFSHVFFGWEEVPSLTSIYVSKIEKELNELRRTYEDMINIFGFEESPYTTITAKIFRQMKLLLGSIEKLPIKPEFKVRLQALAPFIGRTIAVAEAQGDRPCVFSVGSSVVRRVRTYYKQFNQLSESSAAFPLVLEFRGLTEFYAEFAQVDRFIEEQVCQ